jgi:pimeloyl-ACP methyl ester carboxylesterase
MASFSQNNAGAAAAGVTMEVPGSMGRGFPMTCALRSSWLVAVLFGAGGCAMLPGHPAGRVAYTPPPGPSGCRGVVFCLPGAGDFPQICYTLRDAVDEQHLALRVEAYDWSHGYGRIFADHVDSANHACEGERLAEELLAFRRAQPDQRIYLLAHSAGCLVALKAAEHLPPGTIDRIILLAPAVSASYDLRPALLATSRSIEVFYSQRDWAALGIGTTLFGTSDRCWTTASGRTGFQPVISCPQDEALYARLRQHPWDRCLSWTGNRGGHYGTYSPMYFRAYVVPLLRDDG